MDCNKDEAIRAREIAEKKFMAKDMMGAKKFILKAQNLYPGLEGIPQMMATLDVYISAENKLNGEVDWYGILGVDAQADEETIRKQYRKLALILHPDKNKAIGADGAFKLISEAWSLLSDKARRIAFDQKRKGKMYHKVSAPNVATSSQAQSRTNGFYNFTKSTTQNTKSQKSPTRPSHSSVPASSHKSKPNTFWTVCHGCKMQYEYLRVYLNHNLLCPNCHQPFYAVETPPPPIDGSKPTPWNLSKQCKKSDNHEDDKGVVNQGRKTTASATAGVSGLNGSHNQSNFQWSPFSRTGGASTAVKAASVVQQAYEKVKKEREEAQAARKREEALRRKQSISKRASVLSAGHSVSAKRRRGNDGISASGHGRTVTGGVGIGVANLSGSTQGSFTIAGRVDETLRPNITRDVSLLEIHKLLMEKARKEIQKKLNEWKSDGASTGAFKEGNANEKTDQISLEHSDISKHNAYVELPNAKSRACELKSFADSSGVNTDRKPLEPMSINVPDSDFHDFDKERTEKSFGKDQVWAAYDDDDGMPRYYAMIHKVISLNPFKMRISWLNSKSTNELGPSDWVGSGFTKTCGDFRVGKYEIYNSLNSFSHKVRWNKGMRGAICVYPRKGDVWALYRNWSPDWNELTIDEVIHKYNMVQVLEDFNEEVGSIVVPLVKVAGFKTVFHQHLDPSEVRRIPREEMFRFSHLVPSYLLTGQEASNAPKGCLELDPAAIPLEHLQVIADVNGGVIQESEDVTEENTKDS